jgi:hypothetical protein
MITHRRHRRSLMSGTLRFADWRNALPFAWLLVAISTTACSSTGTSTNSPAIRHEQVGFDKQATIPPGYIYTPGGVYVHSSCNHIVPNGAHIDRNMNVFVGGTLDKTTGAYTGGSLLTQLPPCSYPAILTRQPPGSNVKVGEGGVAPVAYGWIESRWDEISAPNFFSGLTDILYVPTGSIYDEGSPGEPGQELFYFPAFENAGGGEIIQPVLQWGSNAMNGNCPNDGWGISDTWLVNGQMRVSSPPACGVNAGDEISSTIGNAGCTNGTCSWWLENCDVTQNFQICQAISFDGDTPMVNAVEGALEAYGVVQCADFPNGSNGYIAFEQTVVYENGGGSVSVSSCSSGQTHGCWFNDPANGISPSCSYNIDAFSGGTTLTF